jgi:hypothetical protein
LPSTRPRQIWLRSEATQQHVIPGSVPNPAAAAAPPELPPPAAALPSQKMRTARTHEYASGPSGFQARM